MAYPFSDLDLARRLERSEALSNARFVEARARVDPAVGAEWIEVAGAYALFDGVGSPCTQTFGLGLFDEVTAEHMEELERFFEQRGADVCHEVSPLAGLGLVNLLCERSYRPVELSSALYRPIDRDSIAEVPRNEKIRVRPIGDEEGRQWAELCVRGWSHVPALADFLLDLGTVTTQREEGASIWAEIDGEPIAVAAMSYAGGVALLAGAATVPEARRQGAQLALLDYRLRFGADRGCDVAMMCAEPGSASQRNAERHGFRIAYTRTKWQLKRP